MRIWSPSGHPRCRWVCSSSEQIWRNSITSLAHQWILCSEWVPSEWESKQLFEILKSQLLRLFKLQMNLLSIILLSLWDIWANQAPFTSESSSKQICLWLLMWEDNRGWTFSGGSVIMDYVLFWPEITLNLKHLNGGFASKMQLFTSQDINLTFFTSFGLLVDYCDVFINCLYSQSDGTYSLQMIHWGASDVMLQIQLLI